MRYRRGAMVRMLQFALATGACSKNSEDSQGVVVSTVQPAAGDVPLGSASPTVLSSRASPSASSSSGAPAPLPRADGPLTLLQNGQQLPAARARRVLHLGDSMVPLVGNYLRPKVEEQGGQYELISTSSSTTLSWAKEATLKQALAKHDPELVLISLGSNELFFVDDLEQRAAAVRGIVQQVGDRVCLWIGPPAWAKARGFLDVLENNLGRCRYFDSAALRMQRQEDGRHPTWGASHAWAMKVWAHLGGESAP